MGQSRTEYEEARDRASERNKEERGRDGQTERGVSGRERERGKSEKTKTNAFN